VGPGYEIGKIIGRVKCQESFSDWGDYMRVLDLVEWNRNGHRWREIRFCQYFRKAGGGDNDWIFGQGAGHMGTDTFYKLIQKATTNPDYGNFGDVFKNIIIKSPVSLS
jgi:hypothetical protein